MSYIRPSQTKSDPIRVLIADNHPLYRQGIEQALSLDSRIEVIGEVADGYETIELVQKLHPTVLILDINLSGISGLEVINRLNNMKKGSQSRIQIPRVLVLTAHCDHYHVTSMIKAGAKGYLSKQESAEEILNGVVRVARGLVTTSDEVTEIIIKNGDFQTALTSRELQVLKLVAHGEENQTIAETLVIKTSTVKNYVSNIYQKLEIRTRAKAVAWAWQNGIMASA